MEQIQKEKEENVGGKKPTHARKGSGGWNES